MKSPFIRLLIWVLLITLGFVAGLSWKNREEDQPGNAHNETNIQNDALALKVSTLPDDLSPDELKTIKLFESASTSVAFITTVNVRMDFWSRNLYEIPRGTGSAFVWDKKGHIITNFHVIQGADKAQVTLADRSTWDAEVVGTAPEKDLAVLRIKAPANKLTPIPVGSSDNLRVGQSAFAIGNPFGLDQTLTTGIVSALGREIKSVAGIPIRDVIQTDAAINPGNSGGPLLDSSGKLIGVNTAIYSPSGAYAGIGFSIPADVVKWVVPELIAYGKIKRPTLGVELATSQQTKRIGIEGALVLGVVEGSAADRAGIRPITRDRSGSIQLGDIIIAVNNTKVASSNDLILALEEYKVGDEIKVRVLRDDKELTLTAVLDPPR